MENLEIRLAAKRRGVYLWKVAAELGYSESGFSRKLRRELPEDEKQKILAIINRLATEVV